MPDGISIREFARRDGCSHTAVQNGIREGYLTMLANNRLDPALVGTGWRSGNRRSKRGGNCKSFASPAMDARDRAEAAAETEPPAGVPPAVIAGRIAAETAQPPPLAESEARKEYYLALLRQLEYEERVGLVLSVADVEEVVGRVIDATRAKMLALPTKAVPLLTGKAQPTEVSATLTRLVHEALNELAATEVLVERIKDRADA